MKNLSASHFAYRPEIDGLRAIAVVAVILYHAGFSLFSGGFVGVDIFFVISGYLICSLILKELSAGTFSFLNYFERRARRIFPALFAMVFAVILMALILMFPGDLRRLGSSLAGVGTFLTNLVFSRQTGYFDAASEFKPLIHTWSLAVEEQFYILFPPTLYVLWRWGKRQTTLVVALLLAASLAAAELTVRAHPDAAFFLPHTRAWELLTGVLAAIFLHQSPAILPKPLQEAGSLAGIGMILWAIFALDSATPFPSLYALPPVIGTAMIILFAREGGLLHRILRFKSLVAMGLISYSAYLWHQPLFAFGRHLYIPDPHGIMMPALILLNFAVAYLSWRFIEAPFRNRNWLSRRAIAVLSAGALGATTLVGFALFLSDGLQQRFSPQVLAQLNVLVKPDTKTDHCKISERDPKTLRSAVSDCYKAGKTLFLIGDSHAEEVGLALREAAEAEGITLITLVEHACPPVENVTHRLQSANCTALKNGMRSITREFPAPVILSSRWRYFSTGLPFDNGEGGREFGPAMPMMAGSSRVNDPIHRIEESLSGWATDNRLIIIDQIPEAGWLVTRALARRVQIGNAKGSPLSTSYAEYQKQNQQVQAMMDRLERDPSIAIIRTAPMVCGNETRRCLNERNGQALYYDDDHPSIVFSRQIAQAVLNEAEPVIAGKP